MTLERWFLELRNLTSIFLTVAITLDVLNRGQLKSWIRDYLPLLIFGFFAAAASGFFLKYKLIVLWAYFLILVWFLALNRRRLGLNISILGAVLNLLVMAVNGGRMPMPAGWAEESEMHQFAGPDTLFPFLSDCILIRENAFSPGDICLHIGAMIFVSIQLYIFLRKKMPVFNKKAP